jgi:serine/threonine-protein kinase
MAPEAFESAHDLDERSDIFSFGVIAYEMYTKKKPFIGTGMERLIYDIKFSAPQDPLTYNPNIPAEICEVISFMLRKAPEERYSNAGELLAALNDIRNYRYKIREDYSFVGKLMGKKNFWNSTP